MQPTFNPVIGQNLQPQFDMPQLGLGPNSQTIEPREGNFPLTRPINLPPILDLEPSTQGYMQPRAFLEMELVLYLDFSYVRFESSLNMNVHLDISSDSEYS